METIPLNAMHSLQWKSVLCPNFHMGILKETPKLKFQSLQEAQKTKLKHKKKQNHQNKTKHTNHHTPPQITWNTKPPTHQYLYNTQTQNYSGWKGLREEKPEGANGQDTAERGHRNAEKHDMI